VDRADDDYTRVVALNAPDRRCESNFDQVRHYAQRRVDVIDLEANQFSTVPVKDVITSRYTPMRYIMQVEQDGYLAPILTNQVAPEKLVFTFDGLMARTPFPTRIREALRLLETHYQSPVDTEFTIELLHAHTQYPEVRITLLQCRPQSHIQDADEASLPRDLAPEDIVFLTQRMVPQGAVRNIRYVMFVTSEGYFSLATQAERTKLERTISDLNQALQDETFIAVGPGRWGTSTPDLGVHVAYGDIFNARALVELSGEAIGASPEPSFGTHFFQDLMEAHIFPLAVFLDDRDAVFNRDFFYKTPNRISKVIKADRRLLHTLRLIAVEDFRAGHHLDLVMDGNQGRAAAYFVRDEPTPPADTQ